MVQSPALQMDGFELNIMPQQLSFGRPPATPTLQQSQSTKELIKIPRRSTYQHNGMSVGNEIMLAEAYQPKSRKQLQRDPLLNNRGSGGSNNSKKSNQIFYFTAADQLQTFPHGPQLSWHSNSPTRDQILNHYDLIQYNNNLQRESQRMRQGNGNSGGGGKNSIEINQQYASNSIQLQQVHA